MKHFVLPLILLLPAPARAQDETIKDFSTTHIEKFIAEVLKVKATKVVVSPTLTFFETPDSFFDVGLSNKPGRRTVVFRYPFKSLKATDQQLSDWNARDGNHTRGSIVKGQVVLLANLNVDAGLSLRQLGVFYEEIQRERRDFVDFVSGVGGPRGDLVHQGFPAKEDQTKHATSWDIEWDFVPCINEGAKILRIVSARFQFKDRNGRFKTVTVARDLMLAEAFSVYDDGAKCFLDLYQRGKGTDQRANLTVQPTPKLEQCVLPGEVVKYSKDDRLRIFKEVHDDGLRWMDGYKSTTGTNRGQRGEKLVLLAAFQAVNYVYLTEYHFTDDGRIVCRLGFTAHNIAPRDNRGGDVHLHVGCWRMDFDLGEGGKGGRARNDYRLVSRRLDPRTGWFKVHDAPFGADEARGETQAREGKALWKAEEFTTLRVQSTEVKNAHGRPIAYDLMATRFGSVRGLMPKGDVALLTQDEMDFVNQDFWITHTPANGTRQPYHKVASLANKRQLLQGKPATLWYSSPALHVPRGEDFGGNGINNNKGLALATWIEFTLRPRDLFDATPLYDAK